MAQRNSLTTQPIDLVSLSKRMLIGAGIALVLILLFLSDVDEPDPNWPKMWKLRPLIIVPIAGALGGAFYYLMDHLFYQGGWRKPLVYLLSLIGYIIALWFGTVLGLVGTLWN